MNALLIRWGKAMSTGEAVKKRSSVPEQHWYLCCRLRKIEGASKIWQFAAQAEWALLTS